MSQEIASTPESTMRTRLAFSTTGRGWDYESTVEVTGPVPEGYDEVKALLKRVEEVQVGLRILGTSERDHRNARDGKA